MADPMENHMALFNEYNKMFPNNQIHYNKQVEIHMKLAELDKSIRQIRSMLAN
jgi:hypothetical protein